MCTLISQLKLWSHHWNSIMFPECVPLNTTPSPPSSQAQLILTINIWKCFWIPIFGQQNGLKSVVLISKHLTLEWWLLAGEYAACQGCIWRKWQEFLSNTYSMACVPRARSHYTRLLWSFSNFPKWRWPLISGKLDWLEWFSLEKLCCWCWHTKAEAYEGLHTKPKQHSGHASLFKSLHKGSDLWHSSSVMFPPPPRLILSYYTLNRITVVSRVWNLLNRCSFLQSPAVKCGHIGDFDAFSMFAAEDSLCDLHSLSGLNPRPPFLCLPLSKIQNLGCENHLDVRGNPSLDGQENGLE